MLNCLLMRRLLLVALALNLTGLGPTPLSVCALFSSKAAECAKPETKSECDQMDMSSGAAKISSAPKTSCCDLSRAPIPETQQNASAVGLATVADLATDAIELAPPAHQKISSLTEQDISPPQIRSFLCTFLI